MKTDPSIQPFSALFAAAAWRDADGRGRTLYHVAQADFIFDQEARQANPVRFPRLGFTRFRSFFIHGSSIFTKAPAQTASHA
jgi:hypothetical protein